MVRRARLNEDITRQFEINLVCKRQRRARREIIVRPRWRINSDGYVRYTIAVKPIGPCVSYTTLTMRFDRAARAHAASKRRCVGEEPMEAVETSHNV